MHLLLKSCHVLASDIIFETKTIQVKRNDLFPKQLCLQCKQGLEVAYNLRKLGEANAKKFENEIKNEKKSEEVKEESEEVHVDEVDEDSENDLEYADDVDDEDYVCEEEEEDDEPPEETVEGNIDIDDDIQADEDYEEGEVIEEEYADPLQDEINQIFGEPMEQVIYYHSCHFCLF